MELRKIDDNTVGYTPDEIPLDKADLERDLRWKSETIIQLKKEVEVIKERLDILK